MRTIVEELELIPVVPQETVGAQDEPDYVKRAQALGFSNVRLHSRPPVGITNLPYPEITDTAIGKLLRRRADELRVERAREDEKGYRYADYYQVTVEAIYMKWVETPIERFEGFPPTHILTSLDKARNTGVFERYAVVTVEHFVDPLLIGITKDNRRALIDHWGKDLTPDEIISLVDGQ